MQRTLAVTVAALLGARAICSAGFHAGAAKVDVTPPPEMMPVIQNGGFLSRTVGEVSDRLYARALVVGGGDGAVAVCVVDSCMIPTPVCDLAKAIAARETGMEPGRMLISATHTHAAPSVMDMCLGTDRDPEYTEFLPGKIAEAIVAAHAALAPAEVGWARFDAADYTQTRRWITAPDKMGTDPFGERTVRAMMHPGYQNPNYVGESGPEDPWFTVLSVRTATGEPLCLLGNFAMHYFGGHPGLSADYFGHYCKLLETKLGGVAILSQGTSGDIWRVDYSKPRKDSEISILRYSRELAAMTAEAISGIGHHRDVPIAIAERRLTMDHRTPDRERLAWARAKLAAMGDRPPKDRPEVYARQAVHLHDNPTTEVVLQALRIGELGITAIPNETYAITGLHLKARSPLPLTMNISLANGATGYIPPPEQHHLGGYNTWPSVTAGLEVGAEPEIVEHLLVLLEEVSGEKRRTYEEPRGAYAQAVDKLEPAREWRLGDLAGSDAFEPGVAFQLPGVAGEGFPAVRESRATAFAGGRMKAEAELGDDYTVAFWFWNGLDMGARPVTAYLYSRGPDGEGQAPGEHIGIGGTHLPASTGKLIAFNGNAKDDLLVGKTLLETRRWYHCVIAREGDSISVYLDGELEIDGGLARTHGGSKQLFFGGRSDNFANLEGRLDEVAVFDRTLEAEDLGSLLASAGMELKEPEIEPALTPEQSLRKVHVPEGFEVELVAAEPLVMDPVAIDWAGDGSVWVAEMADYPSGENGVAGKVVRLVDDDGDRKPDRREELIGEVAFPSGVLAWGAGVLVTAAGEIIYAEDTDGDGEADLRETWFRGFIEGNQQLRVNGLRPGIDGWIYCASGGHHAGFGVKTVIECVKTGEKVNLGSRDFRFRPDGRLEPVAGPSQFGRVCDDEGNWFGVQNAHPLWHYVFDDRYFTRNPDIAAPDPRKQLRGTQPRVFGASKQQKRFHGFDHVGRYTSACGISIYRGEALFPKVAGQTVAFTCEPFSNLVQRHVLTDDGPSFTAERAPDGERDFFASEDRWCRPVMSRTAPDGSLWVVDMYRYMIEHPDWLPAKGQQELKPNYYSGQGKGRLYRVTREGADHRWPEAQATPDVRPSFADTSPGRRRLALIDAEAFPAPPAGMLALADDPDAKVRLQAAFSFGAFDDAETGAALVKIAKRDGDDPYFAAAVLSSAVPHFGALTAVADELSEPIVRGLLKMEREESGWRDSLFRKLAAKSQTASDWRILGALARNSEALSSRARAVLLDPNRPTEERIAASALTTPPDALLEVGNPPELQRAVLRRLPSTLIIKRWRSLSPDLRATAEEVMLQKFPGSLSNAIEAGRLTANDLSASARERIPGLDPPASERSIVVDAFAAALETEGDAARGRAHFLGRCSMCHRVGDLGRQVGPDLAAVSDRSPQALLASILDPSRNVEPRYLGYTALTKDGGQVFGLIAAETANSVVMNLLDGSERVLKRGDIESLEGTGKSAMPAGIEAGMTLTDMADLLAFLAESL